MLTSIKIEKLFDIFDYDIEFKKEGVTILTGPNGYGKTTVLKILDALAAKNGFFFACLLFKKIVLVFTDGDTITLEKKANSEVSVIAKDGAILARWNNKSLEKILRRLPFRQIDENRWIDRRTDEIYDKNDLLKKVTLEFPEFEDELNEGELPKNFNKIPTVYFIREQRLLRPVPDTRMGQRQRQMSLFESNRDKGVSAFSNTIEEYAKELRENIKETLAKSSQITQELDSSFPRRLFDQQLDISEEEFKQRFDKVKEIQKALSEYGLSEIKEDSHPTYKTENAKALYVYINDAEKKLAVFSELLDKLKTFTEILNERRFTFKRIDISKKDGFKFSTNRGKSLALGDLSSGEQQEVVLLYELLFKVQPMEHWC